jgi:hypothetical protein
LAAKQQHEVLAPGRLNRRDSLGGKRPREIAPLISAPRAADSGTTSMSSVSCIGRNIENKPMRYYCHSLDD